MKIPIRSSGPTSTFRAARRVCCAGLFAAAFAADRQPRNGWKLLNFHQNATFKGRNHLLWLGEPGKYGATKPEGVTFLEGAAARAKWHGLRSAWLVAHGYAPVSADDWDPMKAAVAAPRRR